MQHESLEKRRNYFTGRPAVHHGFQRCWNVNGLGASIVARVCRLADDAVANGRRLRVITTGAMHKTCPQLTAHVKCCTQDVSSGLCLRRDHSKCDVVTRTSTHISPTDGKRRHPGKVCCRSGHSLGGALATLAAYEIAKMCSGVDVACYTFGAPRTGNHTFAKCAVAVAFIDSQSMCCAAPFCRQTPLMHWSCLVPFCPPSCIPVSVQLPAALRDDHCGSMHAVRRWNRSVCRECDRVVPDNWSIINNQVSCGACPIMPVCSVLQLDVDDAKPSYTHVLHVQDVVAHRGKMLIYKRPGQRVLINNDGFMQVRCNPSGSQT